MLRDVLELVLPRTCAGCGVSGHQCCPECRKVISDLGPRLAVPLPLPAGMPTTWAAAPYESVVRRVIVAWKDQGRADLSGILATLLSGALRVAIEGSPQWCAAARSVGQVAVVAVPSRATGTRARGRFPVGDLVDHLIGAQRGPQPLLHRIDALKFGRPVADQAGLDHRRRGENLTGAMRLRRRVEGDLGNVPIVLVDDITTTGNTMAEASRTLRKAANAPMLAITVAATVRRGPS